MLNCDQCLSKCHAACCGVVPFSKGFISKHRPVREVLKEVEIETGDVVLETEGHNCPYLKENYQCSVYKDRPEICKIYGNETQINLTCQFQDKDGRMRGRQERRAVERKITKFMENFLKQYERQQIKRGN